jgi:hypothetical protein
MGEPNFEAIAVIAGRKAELYFNTKSRFLDSLPNDVDKKEALRRLRLAIADLENRLFISPHEAVTRVLSPELAVRRLQLDEASIANKIVVSMTSE